LKTARKGEFISFSQSAFYYLTYTPSKFADMAAISSHLHSLGCSSFNKFFWRVPVHQLRSVLTFRGLENVVILKRSRSLVKNAIDDKNGIVELGSLVIVGYRLNRPSTRTRKIIQRALQRAPYFRLCPSVYALPQLKKLRSMSQASDKREMTTPGRLIDILGKLDCRVLRLSRITVLDSSMGILLVERMKVTRRARCRKLIQACKRIENSIRLQGEILSTKAFRLKLSEIKFRYRAMRTVLGFFKREMNIDVSKELVKVSKAISSCYSVLREVEDKSAVATIESPGY